MRLVDEIDVAAPERLVRRVDVGDAEIQDRARMIELLRLRLGEHEPNAIAVEEGKAGEGKEKAHPERVPVERGRSLYVLHRDGDLTDARERERRGLHGRLGEWSRGVHE